MNTVLLVLIAIFIPPLAVFFMTGCGCDLLINICLTILGFIPGHIHAFWLIYRRNKAEKLYGMNGYKYAGNGTFQPMYATTPAVGGTYGATGRTGI